MGKSKKEKEDVGKYAMSDMIGKGGFGAVFKALDMESGQVVAIKQLKTAQIPKDQLAGMMLEIDLLRNLDHPNIVKYIEFKKTKEHLHIVLEYVENGSLTSLLKKFGKFPEQLVLVYVSQVLEGLVYLHQQGVIHRDIKGANILTTKDGVVKLADFGVATNSDSAGAGLVVGTPYWMAPEIIELSGATTASDIWSVGATVVELLTGNPPYGELDAMPALFRIVSDDHPPLPDGISSAAKDFLMQCFQKDPNLRISAKRLLKHPWLGSSRKEKAKAQRETERADIGNVEEVGRQIKQFHQALDQKVSRGPSSATSPQTHSTPGPTPQFSSSTTRPSSPPTSAAKAAPAAAAGSDDEDWDAAFGDGTAAAPLRLPGGSSLTATPTQQGLDRFKDDDGGFDVGFEEGPSKKIEPSANLDRYRDEDEDEDDWGDLGGDADRLRPMAQLQLKVSADVVDDNDDEDPFAEDADFEGTDIESYILRDRAAQLSSQIIRNITQLTTDAEESVVLSTCEELIMLFSEDPTLKSQLLVHHGVIPIMDMLEVKNSGVLHSILRVVNVIVDGNLEIQENLCLVGGIPSIMRFASTQYDDRIRLEVARFIHQMCHTSTLTLQMFISCRGLPVLVDFFKGDSAMNQMGVDCVWAVFKLQSPTPKNDFCHMFAKAGLLPPLVSVFSAFVQDKSAESQTERLAQIMVFFSHADNIVRGAFSNPQVIRQLMSTFSSVSPQILIMLLKVVKNLSMDVTNSTNTLDNLAKGGVMAQLVPLLAADVLDGMGKREASEVQNQVLNTMFNLCRISRERQELAAQAGIVPHLQRVIRNNSPLKQFAIPIVCDLAHCGKRARSELWRHGGVLFYIELAQQEENWQFNAFDAIATWLGDESGKVESALLGGPADHITDLLGAFHAAKSRSIESLLDPLMRIVTCSTAVNRALAHKGLVPAVIERLSHPTPLVRVNLVKILTSLYESHERPKEMIAEFNLFPVVERLATQASEAVLVRTMANTLLKGFRGNVVM